MLHTVHLNSRNSDCAWELWEDVEEVSIERIHWSSKSEQGSCEACWKTQGSKTTPQQFPQAAASGSVISHSCIFRHSSKLWILHGMFFISISAIQVAPCMSFCCTALFSLKLLNFSERSNKMNRSLKDYFQPGSLVSSSCTAWLHAALWYPHI